MIVRVTSGYFLQDLIQLDCPSNRNLVFLLRYFNFADKNLVFRRHAVAVSSCRWQPLPAPLRAACSPEKREKARCRSTAATHRTNREKDNNEPTPCVRSLLFVYRQALKRKKNELMNPSTRSWWGKVDSLFCGKATPVAACHRHTAKSRLSNPKIQKIIEQTQVSAR